VWRLIYWLAVSVSSPWLHKQDALFKLLGQPRQTEDKQYRKQRGENIKGIGSHFIG
jgi:hypothetical protein